MDLISKLSDIQGITFSVFEPMLLTAKENLIIQDTFLGQTAHTSSYRVGEKALFKETENKLVNWSFLFSGNLKKQGDSRTCISMSTYSRVANFIYLQTLYITRLGGDCLC